MHEFLFQLDFHGKVTLRARQSSQSSTWLPEGDGIEVFKTEPPDVGPPPVAAIAPDADWERLAVGDDGAPMAPALIGRARAH